MKGSPTLAKALITAGLVDEFRLMIEPVVLGGGKRLFPDDGQSRPLELVSTTTSSTGVHMHLPPCLVDRWGGLRHHLQVAASLSRTVAA